VTRRNPLELIVHLAVDTVLHPIETTGKSVAIGRMVLGQVGRTAVSVAAEAVNALLARQPDDDFANPYSSNGTSASDSSSDLGPGRAGDSGPSSPADLRRVPPVNEAAHPPMAQPAPPPRRPRRPSTGAPVAVAVDAPAKQQGDPSSPRVQAQARRAPSKKAAVNKPPVARRTAAPRVAKKAAPLGPVATKAAPPKPMTKKAAPPPAVRRTAATKTVAKPVTTAADAGEPPVTSEDVQVTPADIAEVVGTSTRKTAKKSAVKKTGSVKASGNRAGTRTTGKKAAGNKVAGTRTTGRKAAPRSGTTKKAAVSEGPADATPSPGTVADQPTRTGPDQSAGPAADQPPRSGPEEDILVFTSDSGDGHPDGAAAGSGDDGHLEQPLIDPGTVKAVRSEMETGRAAADPDNG
jgi:hypothetical protein